MIIAIDFDSTITSGPDLNYPYSPPPPRKGCPEVIRKLKIQHGHTIIIWTCRTARRELEPMKSYLKEYNIPYDYINRTPPNSPQQSYPKVFADLYIDDKQLDALLDWNLIYYKIQKYVKQ